MMQNIIDWFHSLKRWQRNVIIVLIAITLLTWFLQLIHIGEWWHWEEWQEHIRKEWK